MSNDGGAMAQEEMIDISDHDAKLVQATISPSQNGIHHQK